LHGEEVDAQAVWTRESAAPPTRVCVLWKLTAPGEDPAMLTSINIVPGRTSETVKSMSEISAVPMSPGCPTRMRGRGEEEELKAGPEAVILDQTSPTMRLLGGTWMVLVTT
jgi:hypothetical protein